MGRRGRKRGARGSRRTPGRPRAPSPQPPGAAPPPPRAPSPLPQPRPNRRQLLESRGGGSQKDRRDWTRFGGSGQEISRGGLPLCGDAALAVAAHPCFATFVKAIFHFPCFFFFFETFTFPVRLPQVFCFCFSRAFCTVLGASLALPEIRYGKFQNVIATFKTNLIDIHKRYI